MSWLSDLQQMYSLETLDARLTTPVTTPPTTGTGANGSKDGVDARVATTHSKFGTSPSRWRTPEFYVYYATFVTVIPLMFKVAFDVSREAHPEYHKYAHLLSPGWIPGRQVDNSDSQYSTIRENIPYLFLLLAIHPLLRRLYDTVYADGQQERHHESSSGAKESLGTAAAADRRLHQRVSFDIRFAVLFLCALHGFSALKVFLILYLNYTLATKLPRAYVPVATWIFNICLLFANELSNGYPYSRIADLLQPMPASVDADADGASNWGTWLDSYGGLMPRWHILFNITVLRLISFNLDYYWSLERRGSSPVEVSAGSGGARAGEEPGADVGDDKKKQLDPTDLSDRDRISTPAQAKDYNYSNYFAYVTYSPLFLAGPVVMFNEYIYQLRFPPVSITMKGNILYGIRFLVTLLAMELMLHFIYAVAISKAEPAWEAYTPFQLGMLGYFHLHIIWLKLLIPWRFFRWWALVDGVDPPENMVRCPSDSYSTLAFWRGWHRSINRWTIRYIYVPLGGSGRGRTHGWRGMLQAAINFFAVFTFIAFWHDISLTLLMWGWLVTLFILPEVIACFLFPPRRWEQYPTAYRALCGMGAVGNLLMMVTANLVGFALGIDGVKDLWLNILGTSSGLVFLVCACAAMFTAVQIIFEVREQERRRGIWLRF
ncbi:MAG: glycerol transporter [Thelocarpon superellum]|nr:MAG: glycerol transporter [Thelocarpon superellum]